MKIRKGNSDSLTKRLLDKLNEKDNVTNYSTEEMEIGTWINGSPIYRRVIETTLPDCTTEGTAADKEILIDGLTPALVISLTGFVAVSGGSTIMLPYFETTEKSRVRAYWSTKDNEIRIYNEVKSYSGVPCYIILEYTK